MGFNGWMYERTETFQTTSVFLCIGPAAIEEGHLRFFV